MTSFVLTLIRAFQRALSWWLPPVCRFYPSCSKYTAQAVELWGPRRGLWLGFKRILRCQPYFPGGLDPVPLPPGHTPDAAERCGCHEMVVG